MSERRWLALVLPLFPIEVARRRERGLVGRPLALVERKGGSLYVCAASLEALAAGVRAGSTHAHALAAAPDLVVRERLAETEAEALLALARWAAFALAPRPSTESARHALLVDVTGTELVHGSEPKLIELALGHLRSFGHEARAAIAATPLAALALADEGALRAREHWVIAPPGGTGAALRSLSPRALALEPRILETLADLGIRTLGELLRLPRSTLPARFGAELPALLARALGERPHGFIPVRFPDEIRERLLLEGGTDRPEDLAAAVELVADRALERVLAEGRAPRVLELIFEREGAPPSSFPLTLAAPVSQRKPLLALLRDRLERLDLSRLVVALELRVTDAGRRPERQGLLFSARDDGLASAPGGNEADLAVLLARLEGRLGARNVLRARLVPDHRPERAFVYEPATAPPPRKARSSATKPAPVLPQGPRPLRLLSRPARLDVELARDRSPARFARGGRTHEVTRAVGPERLETGFWDGHEIRRDYWIVVDEAGRERWIFRELESDEWYLHGLYD